MDVDKLRQIQEQARRKVEEIAQSAKHEVYKPLYDRQLLSMTPQQLDAIKAGKTPEQVNNLDATLDALKKRYGG